MSTPSGICCMPVPVSGCHQWQGSNALACLRELAADKLDPPVQRPGRWAHHQQEGYCRLPGYGCIKYLSSAPSHRVDPCSLCGPVFNCGSFIMQLKSCLLPETPCRRCLAAALERAHLPLPAGGRHYWQGGAGHHGAQELPVGGDSHQRQARPATWHQRPQSHHHRAGRYGAHCADSHP